MEVKNKKVIIIGSGFGGLGAACIFGKAGADVTVLEKNEMVGGRASTFSQDGYRFDMGPSWYLMPDVFEQFFSLLGERVEDHLQLEKLSPSYRIFFKEDHSIVDIFSDLVHDRKTVDDIEPGAADALDRYLERAKEQYEIARDKFMYKNYDTILDFFTWDVITKGVKLSVFSKMQSYVERFFSSAKMQKIMQYPLVFLGSSPYNTPALYNIMSHIDFNMGVFYPQGGIYEIIIALKKIAETHGVKFQTGTEVKKIRVENGKAVGVELEDGTFHPADIVISNADVHHTETTLLSREWQTFDEKYWDRRVLAPSALIMYLGVDGRIPSLTHHNLVFSEDWQKNFAEIFDAPQWPTDPSFYVCAPSITDASVAPKEKENLFVLVPIASGLTYTKEELSNYGDRILQVMQEEMQIPDLVNRIEFRKDFSVEDFAERYNSFKGTALGLAHTFKQTAIFRPDTRSKRVHNLYYVGANTNPGIGMPTCLISSQLVYKRVRGNRSAGPLQKIV